MNKKQLTLVNYFSVLPDPRRTDHNKFRHELIDIIVIAIVATICGADSWIEIAQFGEAKEDWFKQFLKLQNGIPSHDTFGRVFSILNPDVFEKCFREWVVSIKKEIDHEIIALDGKSVRRSHGKNERPLQYSQCLCYNKWYCAWTKSSRQ